MIKRLRRAAGGWGGARGDQLPTKRAGGQPVPPNPASGRARRCPSRVPGPELPGSPLARPPPAQRRAETQGGGLPEPLLAPYHRVWLWVGNHASHTSRVSFSRISLLPPTGFEPFALVPPLVGLISQAPQLGSMFCPLTVTASWPPTGLKLPNRWDICSPVPSHLPNLQEGRRMWWSPARPWPYLTSWVTCVRKGLLPARVVMRFTYR